MYTEVTMAAGELGGIRRVYGASMGKFEHRAFIFVGYLPDTVNEFIPSTKR